MARSQLDAVRSGVPVLRSQLMEADIARATVSADLIARQATRSHELTGGPAWALMSKLPVVGEPFRTARGITAAADELGRNALPPLIEAGMAVDRDRLRSENGRIDVAALRRIAPALDAAAASLERAITRTEQLPAATYMGAVDRARADLLAQLRPLARAAQSSTIAGRVLPRMLGADGPQSYLLVFQNNAEARGTGGLPGAFAIVRAVQGEIQFVKFHSDAELARATATVRFDRDYENLYRNAATKTLFLNGNLSPHFPYAAQIWADMWHRHSGQRVDGVLAVDPDVLSGLLALTGPARLSDGTMISAANVVELTQSTAYARFAGDYLARKQFLIDIARAAAHKVTGEQATPARMAKALALAAGERRLLVWSADPDLQAVLEGTAVSGAVPLTSGPYVGLTVINEGGNKLDYYLDRFLSWQRSGCGPRREVTVTVRLTNAAPPGVSPYVTARSDDRGYPVKTGDHRVSIYYAATAGAVARSASIDGKPTGLSAGVERGHPVFVVDVELPRGATRNVVLHLDEPVGTGSPMVLRQPLVRPLEVSIRDAGC